MTDDQPTTEPSSGDSFEQPAIPAPKPEIDVSLLPELPVHPRSQRVVGSNIGRWATFGCVAVMLMLVVLLVIGVNLTKRTVWLAYAKAQQRLIENLPSGIDSGERMRVERNLQRFRARVEIDDDPFPAMGEFLALVTAAFEDEVLSAEELSELNQFMEDSLDPPGSP